MDHDNSQDEKGMDSYTEDVLEHGISRRSFLSRTAIGAAGVGLLGLTGISPKSAEAATADRGGEFAKSSDGGATLNFMPKPKPIADKDIKTTLTFDVVVVGAGASG